MKSFLKILSVCLVSIQTFAGPGASGGGMTPVETLICENRSVVTLDQWISESRYMPDIWIQYEGSPIARNIPIKVSRQRNNLRIFELLDNQSSCTNYLKEVSAYNWNFVTSCIGTKRAFNCRKR